MAASGSALTNYWLVVSAITDNSAARAVRYAGNYLIPNALPNVGEAFAQYVAGWTTESSLEHLLLTNGAKWSKDNKRTGVDFVYTADGRIIADGGFKWTNDPWMGELWSLWNRWDISTINQLLNRGVISDKLADDIMSTQGWESRPERDALRWLRHPIPPAIQLVEMAVRDALLPENLIPKGLFAEYPEAFDRWVRATGIDTIQLPPLDPNDQPRQVDFPRALWAIHWALPTMPQWFEMIRRLRPSIANPQVSADPSGVVLDPALETPLYQANAIHPDWRAALKAISFKPISLRYVDALYEFSQFNRQEVEDALVSYGFFPSLAKKMATARTAKVDRTRRKATIAAAKIQIEAAWELGSIDDASFLGGLQAVGLTDQEAREALRLAGVEHTRKRLDRSIKAIRQQVLTGQMAMDDAQSTLLTIGVQPGRVDEYVTDWTLDLSGRRRLLSGAANVKAAADGLLPLDELVRRLRNLRYADADISILLGELQITLAGRLAKAAAAAEKRAEQSARAAERAVKQLQQAQAQARAALARHGSPGKLKTWFCEGTITEQEVYDRLRFLQWPDADIARLLEECYASNLFKQKKSTTNGAAPAPPGG